MIKVLHVNRSDAEGGAARAAYRVHRSLLSVGQDSRMLVDSKTSDDWTVIGPLGPSAKLRALVRPRLGELLLRMQRANGQAMHSAGWLPSRLARRIDSFEVDVVNLHWICGEMISVADIGRIKTPLVWTLHDMWAFCGSEHYSPDDAGARWRKGYDNSERPAGHWGPDLERWVWKRKKRAWRTPIHVVSPSKWLADCARQSALLGRWPVTVIPNPLDTSVFKPLGRSAARSALNLPASKPLILFGAIGGVRDLRKGFDLLADVCSRLSELVQDFECVVFGQSAPRVPPSAPVPIHWVGRLRDDTALALVYSASDVMVVPSRQENLPQTGTEASACGCPVVAFDTSGLRDVVQHGKTGFLAPAFDTEEMAAMIALLLSTPSLRRQLSIAARARAVDDWSMEVIGGKYQELYRRIAGRT